MATPISPDNDPWDSVRFILRSYIQYWAIDSTDADVQVEETISRLKEKFNIERKSDA